MYFCMKLNCLFIVFDNVWNFLQVIELLVFFVDEREIVSYVSEMFEGELMERMRLEW